MASDTPFSRIAIANRGECAMRLVRAVREERRSDGAELTSIALYTDPDRRALFVREADERVRRSAASRPTIDRDQRPATDHAQPRLERHSQVHGGAPLMERRSYPGAHELRGGLGAHWGRIE